GSGNGTQTFAHPDLVGGNYYVQITQTDHPDCSEDSNVITIVSPNSPLTVTATEVANVTCTNDLGEILVSPSGGYAPYAIELTHTTDPAQTYSVSDVSGFVFGGLSAGDYLVRVVDAQGCEFLSNVGLEGPLPIMTDINVSPANLLCFGDTNGSVWADIPSGG